MKKGYFEKKYTYIYVNSINPEVTFSNSANYVVPGHCGIVCDQPARFFIIDCCVDGRGVINKAPVMFGTGGSEHACRVLGRVHLSLWILIDIDLSCLNANATYQ